MKKLNLIITLFFAMTIFSFHPIQVKASSNVELSVSVMPRKITDTINDFDLSKIRYAQAIQTNTKPLTIKSQGQVKGVSNKREISITRSFKNTFSNLIQKISNLF